jgi:tryptophanyl-tRNA synthetase
VAKQGIIFSGMQPTGRLHLGNYEGALRNWVRLQDQYEMYVGIVDLHALTTMHEDTSELRESCLQLAIDYISAGIDPERTPIILQSLVPEHTELHLLFSMVTPVSWLERVPTYKEKIEQLHIASPPYGLLGYPVLQAADIALYKADTVPVGKDQLPHLELTREIVRRFNNFYGDIFPEPEAALSEAPVLPGIDGRKMSKSYDNAILMSDPPEEIRAKVGRMFTDPEKLRKGDPGRPEICPVHAYHELYSPGDAAEAAAGCRSGELGCVAHKQQLAEYVVTALAPLRERRAALEGEPGKIENILRESAERARAVASKTMAEVRRAMRLFT